MGRKATSPRHDISVGFRRELALDPVNHQCTRQIAYGFHDTYRCQVPLDEFLSEAPVCVCDAAARFDPGRDVPFTPWLRMVSKGRMRNLAHRWLPVSPITLQLHRDDPPVVEEMGGWDSWARTYREPSDPNEADDILSRDYEDRVRELASRIVAATWRRAFLARFLRADCATVEGLAEYLGCSPRWAAVLLRNAIRSVGGDLSVRRRFRRSA